jgi:hypothetical protein
VEIGHRGELKLHGPLCRRCQAANVLHCLSVLCFRCGFVGQFLLLPQPMRDLLKPVQFMSELDCFGVEIALAFSEEVILESPLLLPDFVLQVLHFHPVLPHVVLHQVQQVVGNAFRPALPLSIALPQSAHLSPQFLPHTVGLSLHQFSQRFEAEAIKLLKVAAVILLVEIHVNGKNRLFAVHAIPGILTNLSYNLRLLDGLGRGTGAEWREVDWRFVGTEGMSVLAFGIDIGDCLFLMGGKGNIPSADLGFLCNVKELLRWSLD